MSTKVQEQQLMETPAPTVRSVSTETLGVDFDAETGGPTSVTLEFNDGAPSDATATLLYDNFDLMHGVEAFLNSFPGASLAAMRRGSCGIGVKDNDVLARAAFMDSAVAVPDRELRHAVLHLVPGPDERPDGGGTARFGSPTGILGGVDDMWFGWVTDSL